MSAEVLREAAKLMRERAEAVPRSPWWPYKVGWSKAKSEDDCDWIVDSNPRLIAGNIGTATDARAEPIAEHIASWHPAVALAVADWLEAEASTPAVQGYDWSLDPTRNAALSVARAYLGGES